MLPSTTGACGSWCAGGESGSFGSGSGAFTSSNPFGIWGNFVESGEHKIIRTTTIQVTVQERGGGQLVREATVTITETQNEYVNDDGQVVRTDPSQTTATASNTGKGIREYTEESLRKMESIAKDIVEVSRQKQFDPTIALGIALTETHMGMLKSRSSSLSMQTDVNPMQVTPGSGHRPTTDRRYNIAQAIDYFNEQATSNLNQSLQNYNREPGRAAYARAAEDHINAIRSTVRTNIVRYNNWHMRDVRPPRVGFRPR